MLKWILFSSLIASLFVIGYFYVNIKQLEVTPSKGKLDTPSTITLVHASKDGIHRYTGYIKLAHSCFTIESEVISDQTADTEFTILITSTNHIAEQKSCFQIPTRYPFDITAEGSENPTVTLKVDNLLRPIKIIDTSWTNARGTTVTQ